MHTLLIQYNKTGFTCLQCTKTKDLVARGGGGREGGEGGGEGGGGRERGGGGRE